MLPGGSMTPVKGTVPTQVYFASHAMHTFSPYDLTVYGRVLDENGTPVSDVTNDAITISEPYGNNCSIKNKLALTDGLFKTTVRRYADDRSFAFTLELAAADHIVLEEDVVVDVFIQTDKLYITLQTFSLDKRTLGGVYRFKIVDAFTLNPVSGLKGTFLISPTETGEFKSNHEGDVYLENLRVGITNI